MSQELKLELKTQLKLSPQLQQSLKLLKLTQLELAQEIQQQLDTNPLLVCEDSLPDKNNNFDSDYLATNSKITARIDLETSGSESQFSELESYWEALPQNSNLKQHLVFQLQLLHLSEKDFSIGHHIIENLNDKGFLRTSVKSLSKLIESQQQIVTSQSEIETVKHLIQSLEPTGCGSENLKEFWKFQLIALNKNKTEGKKNLLLQVTQDHFNALVNHKYSDIQQKIGISKNQLKTLMQELKSLRQIPNDYSQDIDIDYIRPEISFFADKGVWRAQLLKNQIPKLRVNEEYKLLAKQTLNVKDKEYIHQKNIAAKQFINSLKIRQNTLQKVASFLAKFQNNFFEHGDKSLRPLTLKQASDALELHPSTISRATSNKYCQTPWGIIQLKHLFSNSIQSIKGGECSQTAVKYHIRTLISAENLEKPLSDSSITTLLKKQGISIARRTVAKYREALEIPSAYKRKQLSALF